MKTDFHSHILPGLDDGATDIDDAVEITASMADWGFERITCTPHINASYRNTPEDIRQSYDALQEALYLKGINVDLKMSAEYRLVPETWHEVLAKDWLIPIEDKYILTELPISNPKEMGGINPLEEFKKLTSMGLTPILPHPERYFYLSQRELMCYLDAGVVIQCNYGSFAGLYGLEVQSRAQDIQNQGIITLYGTDMHNMKYIEIIGKWLSKGNNIIEF